ncbi:MAG: phenylalanine--tRNA ligase subunit beta [Acidobacteriota bacterium]
MRISLNWLRKFVDIDILGIDPDEVARSLTMVGLAVELVEAVGRDTVLDLDITTNRPDCLNHLGVARELAARYRLKLRKPVTLPPPTDPGAAGRFPASIEIEAPADCPRYAGRVLTDVEIAESPDWLKGQLEAVGQRPINNVVDITNFILFELGQPLHAFDYQRLAEPRIVVRHARSGEGIRTLDGVVRTLDDTMLAICDAVEPVAVAGVMGGEESEISVDTRTILLESAFFNPASIRRTSKSLDLSTEASFRFERGADPEMPVQALNRACQMLQDIAGAKCATEVMDIYPGAFERRRLVLRHKRLVQVLGVDVDLADARDILQTLEFEPEPEGDTALSVNAPSFRSDIGVEDDLVEEVARHFGYDRIPSSYPRPFRAGLDSPTARHEQLIVDGMVQAGFSQAVNFSFSNVEREGMLLGKLPQGVRLANPLNDLETHLRTSLLSGLLDSVRRNLNFGVDDVRLFEMGTTYHPDTTAENGSTTEKPGLGFAALGRFYDPFWNVQGEELRFFHLKGLLDGVFAKLGFDFEYEPVDDVAFLHPGIAAAIMIEGRRVGLLGALHPRLQEEYKFSNRVFYGELDLEPIYSKPVPEPTFVSPGRFPSVARDISFILDKTVPYGRIVSLVQALKVSELRTFRLIDLYHGQSLPQDKISLTVRLTFEAPDRTLTQAEVAERCDVVVGSLKEQLGIVQR